MELPANSLSLGRGSVTPFQVHGVYKETTLQRGRDYEGGLCVALILPL